MLAGLPDRAVADDDDGEPVDELVVSQHSGDRRVADPLAGREHETVPFAGSQERSSLVQRLRDGRTSGVVEQGPKHPAQGVGLALEIAENQDLSADPPAGPGCRVSSIRHRDVLFPQNRL